MKVNLCLDNKREADDFDFKVHVQTNLGAFKLDLHNGEKQIRVFGIPLKQKEKPADGEEATEDNNKKEDSEKKAEEFLEGDDKPSEESAEGKGKSQKLLKIKDLLSLHKDGLRYAINQLVKALTRMRLDLKGTDVSFSAGSPDVNGYVLAVLSILPAIYDRKVLINTDFKSDDAYFEGRLRLNARIYLFKILIDLIKILLYKDSRELILGIIKKE